MSISRVSVLTRDKNAKIDCEKLPTKYDTYCSYHVTVTIDSVLFNEALSCLMSSEAWPMGMLVRRFFIKRIMATINNDITIRTFNFRGIKSSLSEVWQLCDMYDAVCVQEHWKIDAI